MFLEISRMVSRLPLPSKYNQINTAKGIIKPVRMARIAANSDIVFLF